MTTYKDKMQDSRKNLSSAKNDIESAMSFLDQVKGLEVMDTDGLISLNRMLSTAIAVIEGEMRIIGRQTSASRINFKAPLADCLPILVRFRAP